LSSKKSGQSTFISPGAATLEKLQVHTKITFTQDNHYKMINIYFSKSASSIIHKGKSGNIFDLDAIDSQIRLKKKLWTWRASVSSVE
jgi:hypothetical protein